MYEGIVQAHEHLQPVLDLIDKMVSEIGKPKFEYEHASFDEDLFELLCANEMEGHGVLHGHRRQERARGARE